MKKLYLLSSFLLFCFFSQAQNVGIGTSMPNQKLEVVGWVEIGNESEGSSGTAGTLRYHTSGKIQFYDGTQWVDIFSGNNADEDWTKIGGGVPTDADDIYHTGNVGIGTSSAGQKLEVNGNLRLSGGDRQIDINSGYLDIRPHDATHGIILRDYTGGSTIWSGFRTIDDATDYLHITMNSTSSSEGLSISDNGNVGVGVTAPTQKLHVAGNIRATSLVDGVVKADASGNFSVTSLTGDADDVLLGDGTFGPGLAFGDNLGDHSATENLDMNSHDITEVNRIVTLGVSDYDKLRVYSSANYTIGMHSGMSLGYLNDWAMTFTMNNDADRGWVWRDVDDADTDGAMSLTTNGRLYLNGSADASGTAGSGIFEIAGSLRFDDNEIITNDDAALYLQNDNNGDLRVDGSTLAVDASEDRVGIGTTAPNSTLDVNGDIEFSGNALVAATNHTTNIDHIWHDDGANAWHMVSDGSYKATGNSLLYIGRLWSSGVNESSDIRLKTNISKIENALSKVIKLRGVTYEWNNKKYPERNFEEGKQLGVIAQEIEKVFPEIVSEDSKGFKAVEYSHLVPVLIEAIKELNTQLEQKDKEIKMLSANVENKSNEYNEALLDLNDKVERLYELLELKSRK